MIIFMMFYIFNQIFQFLLVGSFYLSIKIFFSQFFATVLENNAFVFYNEALADWFKQGGGFETIFSYCYIGLLCFICLMSLGGVLDKSMPVFKIVAICLAVTTVFFLFGTTSFLTNAGFVSKYRDDISQDTTC